MTKAAQDYANKYYKEMVEIVAGEMQEEMGVSIMDMKYITLGKPYYIYDVEAEEQNAEYYFPIYHMKEIILMMHVTCAEDGWAVSMDTEDTYTLNQLEYGKEECVFYRVGDDVYAENGSQKVHMRGDGSNKSEFKNKDLKEKKEEIGQDKKKIVPLETEKYGDEDAKTGAGGESNETSTGIYLSMNSYYEGQGDYNLCWAACVATTYNYRNGYKNTTTKALTAEEVGTAMKENYKSSAYVGANDKTIVKAFRHYDLAYQSIGYAPSWSHITKNIKNKYPVTVSGVWRGGYHAGLITAYFGTGDTRFVKIWDPNEEDVQIVKYPASEYDSFAFVSNGTTYGICKGFLLYK